MKHVQSFCASLVCHLILPWIGLFGKCGWVGGRVRVLIACCLRWFHEEEWVSLISSWFHVAWGSFREVCVLNLIPCCQLDWLVSEKCVWSWFPIPCCLAGFRKVRVKAWLVSEKCVWHWFPLAWLVSETCVCLIRFPVAWLVSEKCECLIRFHIAWLVSERLVHLMLISCCQAGLREVRVTLIPFCPAGLREVCVFNLISCCLAGFREVCVFYSIPYCLAGFRNVRVFNSIPCSLAGFREVCVCLIWFPVAWLVSEKCVCV